MPLFGNSQGNPGTKRLLTHDWRTPPVSTQPGSSVSICRYRSTSCSARRASSHSASSWARRSTMSAANDAERRRLLRNTEQHLGRSAAKWAGSRSA